MENDTTNSYFFLLIPLPSHFHPTSCHSLGRDVVSRVTGNLSKILVPSEVYVDAALNKDNLLHPIKYYKSINYIDVTKIDLFPVLQKLSADPKDTNFSEYALKHQQKKGMPYDTPLNVFTTE